jgi:hypothetical protein
MRINERINEKKCIGEYRGIEMNLQYIAISLSDIE